MKFTDLDMNTWNHAHAFYNYYGTDMPYIIITGDVDATRVLEFAHDNKVSFNLCMVYLTNKIADAIPNYRYRFKEKQVFEIEYNRPVVNHMRKGEEQFIMLDGVWPCDDIITFCRETMAQAATASPRQMKELCGDRLDFINYTAIPWVNYSAFFRTIKTNGMDSNPKISFGKYAKKEGKIMIPVSSQTHHGLMDGYQVGRFYEMLQEELLEF